MYYWDDQTDTSSLDWLEQADASPWTNVGFITTMNSDNGAFVIDTSNRATWGIETNHKLKARLYLPDSIVTDESQRLIEDQFMVKLKDKCADNKLSITAADNTANGADHLYYIGDPTSTDYRPVVTKDEIVSKCPLACTLEYYDENTKLWRASGQLTTTAAGQDEHPSLSTFTTGIVNNWVSVNTGYWDISISEADALTQYDGPNGPHTDILYRTTWTDIYSDEVTTDSATGNTVTDEYVVTIMDKCTINELTRTNELGVLLQYVDHTSPTSSHPVSSAYSMTFTATQPDNTWPNCLITHTLEFWDIPTQEWVVYSAMGNGSVYPFIANWNSANGQFTIYTADFTNYDNTSFLVRVTAEDLYSDVEGKEKITDTFTIELRDECHDIVIYDNGSGLSPINGNIAITDSSSAKSGSGTEADPHVYHTWQQQTLAIKKIRFANKNTPTVPIDSTRCIVDYEITDINEERSELFSSHGDTATTNNDPAYDYYIHPNDGTDVNQVLTGVWDHDSPGGAEKNGYFWIRALVYHNKIGVSPTSLISPVNQKSAQLHTGTIVLQQEVKLWVNIIDPCIRGTPGATNSIIVPSAIADMIYVINNHPVATTANVNFWKDEASVLYGYGNILLAGSKSQDNPWHVCGKKTYQVYRTDKTTEMDTTGSVYPYFTWTDSVHSTTTDPTDIILSVRTNDP